MGILNLLGKLYNGVVPPLYGFRIPVTAGLRLNVGCGSDYMDGFINVDMGKTRCDVICDIQKEQLPIVTGGADYILAAHLLEHLTDFATAMNEFHRVLHPGGILDIIVPAPCPAFWRDPTHVRPYTASTFRLYCMLPEVSPYASYLGLRTWSGCNVRQQIENFNGEELTVVYARMTR